MPDNQRPPRTRPDGWTPDARPRVAKATRFFARLLTFDLECPHCGTVYSVRTANHGRKPTPDAAQVWDPTTGRFTCHSQKCSRRYILGILAWSVKGGPRSGSATPEDQVPSPRQLAQMRREGGGWWMPEDEGQRLPRPQETNLTTEEERPHDEDED